ncbi:MAG: DUF2271 domain-containing protein [candidate division KSB1 bacterium]|nr:DUF2271 domain-containing protein [candidate division KSB1 bacterium]
MRKSGRTVAIIATVLAMVLGQGSRDGFAQTQGRVTFRVTTTSYGGKYADKHVGAIWVEDAQNQFIKTLKVWAKKRIKHLVKWNAASNGNKVDAITSATLRSHRSHEVTWNCTDVNGAVVSDGVYRIYVEFTEDNSAKSSGKPGKWMVVEFTKGPNDQTVNPPDKTYFKNIELIYTASGSAPPQLASVSGRVQDSQSQSAIVDATVTLLRNGQSVKQTQSGSDGGYQFADIQAGTYTIRAAASGYQPGEISVTLQAGDALTGRNILLDPVVQPASLQGKVVDASNQQPIAGATVQLQVGGQVKYETRTVNDGQFGLPNIQPGTYSLVAFKDGYETASETITLADGQQMTGKILQLTPVVNGASFSGTILDAQTGQPVNGATVQLLQSGQVVQETQTDASGRFAVSGRGPRQLHPQSEPRWLCKQDRVGDPKPRR